MSPELRMTRARTRLLLDQPWFGTLAMRLMIRPEEKIETMDVDGVTLRYSPKFLATLSDSELHGVLAHEVMHCALLHVFRRGSRDPFKWNVAADYAINQTILDAGLTLPQGCLIDPKFKGMSADQIYAMLPDMPNQGKGKPSPTGKFSDAPSAGKPDSGKGDSKGNGDQDADGGSDVADQMSERDWQIAAEQATNTARKAGKLPADMDRQVKVSREPSADWRTILRQFIAATVPSDYSWSHPSRRHIANGVYLPGTVKENIGALVIAIDTSGSIDQKMLDAFANEMSGILTDARPEKLSVVYCDARVQATQEFVPGDIVELNARGGGGTAFQPVFDWVSTNQASGDLSEMKALIYLTDLECFDKPVEPDYPVLWCSPLWATHPTPGFGELVKIDTDR